MVKMGTGFSYLSTASSASYNFMDAYDNGEDMGIAVSKEFCKFAVSYVVKKIFQLL